MPDSTDSDLPWYFLMTPEEHQLVTKLGQCASDFIEFVSGPNHPEDAGEFISHIHDLQARVLAQCAARAFPKLYRLQGTNANKG